MAVSFDAASSSKAASASSLTWSHTTTGNFLMVAVAYDNASGTSLDSVTYDGVSMTSVGSSSAGSTAAVQMFALVSPATGANNVVATFSGSTADIVGGAVSFAGVLVSGTVDDAITMHGFDYGVNVSSTATSISLSETSQSGSMLVDAVVTTSGGSLTVGAGQTSRVERGENEGDAGVGFNVGMSTEPGTGSSVAMQWTLGASLSYGSVAFNIVQVVGVDGAAAFSVPIDTLSAAGGTGIPGASSFSLPILTLVAVGFDSIDGLVAFDLPMLTLEATHDQPATSVMSSDITIADLELAATGLVGTIGAAAFNLPALELTASGGVRSDITLPALGLSATGNPGTLGAATFNLPALSLVAQGLAFAQATATFDIPPLQLRATGLPGTIGAAVATLPVIRLSTVACSGSVGAAVFDLPVITLTTTAYTSSFGAAYFTLPMLQASALGYATLTAHFRTWALNMRNKALTEYDGWSFNSFADLNGVVLAASSTGLYTLGEQNLDGAARIIALVKDGRLDYDSSMLKRMPRIYTGLKQEGDIKFTLTTTEGGRRSYMLPRNGEVTDIQSRRVPVGKGPKSRYWQWEVTNEDGEKFSLESVAMYPVRINRRVR